MEETVCRGEIVFTPESALSARMSAARAGVIDSTLTEEEEDDDGGSVDLELEFAVEGRQQLLVSRRRFGVSLVF